MNCTIIFAREYFCLNFVKDRYSHAIIHVLLQEENLNRAKYEVSFIRLIFAVLNIPY